MTTKNLIITRNNEPNLTIDNLEVAQFIHLMIDNEKIRQVVDTITSKVVLILGRFSGDGKCVLDAIREELRKRDYLPMLFDFEKPASRNLIETISTLAHMSRFVIADVSDERSVPQELYRIIPGLSSVPVQPLLHVAASEYALFEDLTSYSWVLDTYKYESIEGLIASLADHVIAPAEDKVRELRRPRSAK